MPDRAYYAEYELRIIMLELRSLIVEYRELFDEQELRGWITKNGRHILIGEDSSLGSTKSNRSISKNTIDNSRESDIIELKESIPATEQEIASFVSSIKEIGFEEITGFENYTESNEHLLEISADFSRLKADYPDYFKGLSLNFGTVKEMTDDDYAGYDLRTGTIHLNPAFYNNFERMREAYSSDVRKNYHPAGTDYRAIIFHEFGHRAEHIDGVKPKKQVRQIFEKTFNKCYTRKQADDWIKSGLSLYAAEYDFDDFIAECFAEYYNSKHPRKICKDMMQLYSER